MSPLSWLVLGLAALLVAWLVVCEWTLQSAPPAPPTALVGKASRYGEEHRGQLMANGQPFNPDLITCASWHWPLGTTLRVAHGDVAVLVTVTDRGPSRKYADRVVDLSRAAFTRLANPDVGLIDVTVTPLR